ncbi:hypothetical protein [Corynebacterium terpenotabidum]|uniref:Uncharacterized protein n=1 Tax=Corynebacterium terpenotabidum Y-11 TaxID=1200352 RepID=S4XLF9_9CORY|nr:hypothetical protein [Corynebacterium terpenotabidum]AGP31428.1 hypothetical protein A606_08935 [Corynebacterium terpenotabidum Y-11]
MTTTLRERPRHAAWPWIPWLPLAGTVIAAAVLLLLDPPMRDLQAALARESAHRSGVGVTYWFDWFGGVAPGSYSLIVPSLTSWVGSMNLLCLATVLVAALAYPVSRSAAHPTLLTWAVALAAVLNMFSGRVTFATGAAIAMVGVWWFRRRRRGAGAAMLLLSGLASPLVPAFAGMIILPFVLARGYRTTTMWWAFGGAALGVGVPYALFGAPGSQPYPWTSFLWYLIIGIGAVAAMDNPTSSTAAPARWIAPISMVVATVLFIIPTGVGSNLGRFFLFVLPCVVLYWSLKSPKVLALLLSPALVYALFYALYDQVTVNDGPEPTTLYAPLTEHLDDLVTDGRVDNHRVELIDTGTHAGSYLVTESVPLARGWENQSDMLYNPVFFEKDALDADSYLDWLSDNAVAYVAVAAEPILQQRREAELIGTGLPYLTEVWGNDDWTLYRVTDPVPIVAEPLRLVATTPSEMTVDVPDEAVGTDHLIRIRPNRYLTATLVPDGKAATSTSPTTSPAPIVDPVTACLVATDDNWTMARFDEPGRYIISGQFSVEGILEPLSGSCADQLPEPTETR